MDIKLFWLSIGYNCFILIALLIFYYAIQYVLQLINSFHPWILQVALLKFTGYKIISNISDTGKAFLIILITDIFLG